MQYLTVALLLSLVAPIAVFAGPVGSGSSGSISLRSVDTIDLLDELRARSLENSVQARFAEYDEADYGLYARNGFKVCDIAKQRIKHADITTGKRYRQERNPGWHCKGLKGVRCTCSSYLCLQRHATYPPLGRQCQRCLHDGPKHGKASEVALRHFQPRFLVMSWRCTDGAGLSCLQM
jgi:hypothetical protein